MISGLWNNLVFNVYQSKSQELANLFGYASFSGMYQLSLQIFSILVKLTNSRYFLKILHRKKILATCMVSFCTLLILSYCYGAKNHSFAFILTLIASLGGGFSQSLGEMTFIGLTKGIDPFCVSGFSSGTGFSGIFTILAEKILDKLRKSLGPWVSSLSISLFADCLTLDLHSIGTDLLLHLLCSLKNFKKKFQSHNQNKISSQRQVWAGLHWKRRHRSWA